MMLSKAQPRIVLWLRESVHNEFLGYMACAGINWICGSLRSTLVKIGGIETVGGGDCPAKLLDALAYAARLVNSIPPLVQLVVGVLKLWLVVLFC